MVSNFDMITPLSDEVKQVVNVVLGFFDDPPGAVLGLNCVLKDQDAALEDVCDNTFNNPDDPSLSDLTVVGTVSFEIINARLLAILEDSLGQDVILTGNDVAAVFKDIDILSTITLKNEPDAAGFLGESSTEHEWHTVSFQWTVGAGCNPDDPDCGLKSFSFNAIGQDLLAVSFAAQAGGDAAGWSAGTYDKMTVEPHPLSFKYGAFVNVFIEKVLLPTLAGDGSDGLPVVDSWEKFLRVLVGGKECLLTNTCCTVWSEEVAAQTGGWVEPILKSGCDLMVSVGADYLRGLLSDLDGAGEDEFVLGTKEGIPCTLYDVDASQTIDSWGKKEPPELNCLWDVKVKLEGGDHHLEVPFWGIRQQ